MTSLERLHTLRGIDRAIREARSVEAIACAATERMGQVLPCRRASVALYDFDRGVVEVLATFDVAQTTGPVTSTFPLEYLPPLASFWKGEAQVVADLAAQRDRSPLEDVLAAGGVRSLLRAPLVLRGRVVGALTLLGMDPGVFEAEHVDIAREVAAHLVVAIENARLLEEGQAASRRLRALSRRLVQLQEAERRAIACELHDEIGQALTGVKLTLQMSAARCPEDVAARLGEARALVDDLISRVRRLSLDLRPPVLDHQGLIPAIEGLVERYTAQTGISVSFEHSCLKGRPPSEVETTAYRVVQEALTNVARHADASSATVRVVAGDDVLTVEVADEGCGFDLSRVRAQSVSAGLSGMEERAALLGGQVTIGSAPGAGTKVTARLPLESAAEVARASAMA